MGAKEPHSSCVSPVKLDSMGRKWHLGVAENNTDATMETLAEVSVAGGALASYFPKTNTKKCMAVHPIHQPFLLSFLIVPPAHGNQIQQGQAPIDQASCWNLILLRSQYPSTVSDPVCLSHSGSLLPCLPAPHAPPRTPPSPTYQDHPTILSLCLSSASEEHVWTRVPSEVRRRKKGS